MMSTVRPQYSSYSSISYGPTFGGGFDLYLANQCNRNKNSYTNLGYTYKTLSNYKYGGNNAKTLLAGSYNFQCSEYEVYYLTTTAQRRTIAKRKKDEENKIRQITKRLTKTLANSNVMKNQKKNMKNRLYNFVSRATPLNKQWTKCFTASEDAYLARKFHQRCDNKGPTLTLVRSGSHLFGAYNQNSWTSKF